MKKASGATVDTPLIDPPHIRTKIQTASLLWPCYKLQLLPSADSFRNFIPFFLGVYCKYLLVREEDKKSENAISIGTSSQEDDTIPH